MKYVIYALLLCVFAPLNGVEKVEVVLGPLNLEKSCCKVMKTACAQSQYGKFAISAWQDKATLDIYLAVYTASKAEWEIQNTGTLGIDPTWGHISRLTVAVDENKNGVAAWIDESGNQFYGAISDLGSPWSVETPYKGSPIVSLSSSLDSSIGMVGTTLVAVVTCLDALQVATCMVYEGGSWDPKPYSLDGPLMGYSKTPSVSMTSEIEGWVAWPACVAGRMEIRRRQISCAEGFTPPLAEEPFIDSCSSHLCQSIANLKVQVINDLGEAHLAYSTDTPMDGTWVSRETVGAHDETSYDKYSDFPEFALASGGRDNAFLAVSNQKQVEIFLYCHDKWKAKSMRDKASLHGTPVDAAQKENDSGYLVIADDVKSVLKLLYFDGECCGKSTDLYPIPVGSKPDLCGLLSVDSPGHAVASIRKNSPLVTLLTKKSPLALLQTFNKRRSPKADVGGTSGVDVGGEALLLFGAADSGDNVLLFSLLNHGPLIAPLPPLDVHVRGFYNRFLTRKDYVKELSWKKSPSEDIVAYQIFKNSILIAEVSAQVFKYLDYGQDEKVKSLYGVAAVNSDGQLSEIVSVRF
jgi:hypothetical protein